MAQTRIDKLWGTEKPTEIAGELKHNLEGEVHVKQKPSEDFQEQVFKILQQSGVIPETEADTEPENE
jgi:hypothetical protein